MTAPHLDLLDALREVLGDERYEQAQRLSASMPPSASDLDEDTLRRSFGGLSRSARREQRRPRVVRDAEPWMDELGRCTEGGGRDVC